MIESIYPQRSDEWFQERLGLPSASHFGEIVTTQGKPSKQRDKYMYELAGERLTGRRMERFVTQKMRGAVEREPQARAFFELYTGHTIRETGICYINDAKRFGASPDGLIDPDGGLELKDAEPHVQLERLHKGWSKADHFQQVQGCLWICERNWWNLMSYCDGLEPVIIPFERDEKFISILAVEVEQFCNELEQLVARLAV